MRGLIFATFRHRAWAESARRRLSREVVANDERRLRLHEGAVDPMMAFDLMGCRGQVHHERSVAQPFLGWFIAFGAAGLAVDLFVIDTFAGFVATMLLGSIGVAVGTIAVLASEPPPIDQALASIREALEGGEVLLTVPVSEGEREAVERRIGEHGGRSVFGA